MIELRWLRPQSGDGPALMAVLDEAERLKALRLHHPADRLAYAAAHALLRTLLSEVAGGAPQDWRFAASPTGKPHLDVGGGGASLKFSLSHARGMVACAVASMELGLDVEPLARLPDALALARAFFSEREAAALATLEDPARSNVFVHLWTLKEAYYKAIETGLPGRLDRPDFDLALLARAGQSCLPVCSEDWTFTRFVLPGSFVLALAARSTGGASMPVSCREAAVQVNDVLSTAEAAPVQHPRKG